MVGVSEFVPLSRMKTTSALSRYHMQQEEDHFIPVDVLFDLERVAGTPLLTELLCKLHGFRMLPIEAETAADAVHIESRRTNIADAISELSLTIKRALADRVIDARERRDILRLGEEAIREIRDLLKDI